MPIHRRSLCIRCASYSFVWIHTASLYVAINSVVYVIVSRCNSLCIEIVLLGSPLHRYISTKIVFVNLSVCFESFIEKCKPKQATFFAIIHGENRCGKITVIRCISPQKPLQCNLGLIIRQKKTSLFFLIKNNTLAKKILHTIIVWQQDVYYS